MGKLKTKKFVAKRFKVTKNKKVLHRAAGQDHFNGRENGKTTRNKRVDRSMAQTHVKTIISALH